MNGVETYAAFQECESCDIWYKSKTVALTSNEPDDPDDSDDGEKQSAYSLGVTSTAIALAGTFLL